MKIVPGDIKTPLLHQYLLGAVSPRPICFASTLDASGNANLSPFSFFNVMGSHPPVLVFSPSRKVRDNSLKHTLLNAEATGEVVINVVTYKMVQQMNLSSCEYPEGVDEFVKAGFTKIASEKVKPFRVAESPVQMECRVNQIIKTGDEGGAGNIIICEVLMMHINDEVLDDEKRIDPYKLDLVARMGLDYYCRASGSAIFTVPKPHARLGIGIDQLPDSIRNSKLLTGNQLGMLANIPAIPDPDPGFTDEIVKSIVQYYSSSPDEMESELQRYAGNLVSAGELEKAWQVLLVSL